MGKKENDNFTKNNPKKDTEKFHYRGSRRYVMREKPVLQYDKAGWSKVSDEFKDENGEFDQKKYLQEYLKEAYDRIEIKIPKGLKGPLRDKAKQRNMSMQAYIMDLIYNPLIVASTDNVNNYEASTHKEADRLERIFKDNMIRYERNGKVISVKISDEDIKRLLNKYII